MAQMSKIEKSISESFAEKEHSISLVNRSKMSLSGVNDVSEFSDSQVMLKTSMGGLCIKGKNLSINQLNTDTGMLDVKDTFDTVCKQRQGRIFCGSVQMISREVYVFLAMIICGGALAVVFDMLRAMRMVLNPSAVIVSASDILFWIFAAYVISAAAWNFNSGIFRFYEPLGIILGAVFYFLLFSKWILKLFLFIFENILKFAKFIFKILLTPPKFLYKILIVPIIGVIKNKRRKGHDTHDE